VFGCSFSQRRNRAWIKKPSHKSGFESKARFQAKAGFEGKAGFERAWLQPWQSESKQCRPARDHEVLFAFDFKRNRSRVDGGSRLHVP
jgi:hypothetical protein